MPRPTRTRSQPHRIVWPLSPSQVENVDEMFEILFRAMRTTTDRALAAGDTAALIAEVPAGLVNSANALFTTSDAYSNLQVYLNGLRQDLTDDYTETSASSFTFVVAPTTGDKVTVTYQ